MRKTRQGEKWGQTDQTKGSDLADTLGDFMSDILDGKGSTDRIFGVTHKSKLVDTKITLEN